MPRFDPTEFGRLLARLTPHELRQAEGMVAEARERAEAVMEIDTCAERAVRRRLARAAAVASGFAGAGRGQARSDGAARAAGRVGRGAAIRRSPGCIGPI